MWWIRATSTSWTHWPIASTNPVTASLDVYVAFFSSSLHKFLRCSPPQLTTRSTSWSNLVVCGMWCLVRKCVQRSSALTATLFFYLFFFTYVLKLLTDSALSGYHYFSFTRLNVDVFSEHENASSLLFPVIEWLSNPCSSSSLKHSSSFFAHFTFTVLQPRKIYFHSYCTFVCL